MRILWVHNFPENVVASGCFMFTLAGELRRIGVDLDLLYTGSLRSLSGIAAARRNVAAISQGYDIAHAQFGSACSLVTSAARCRRMLSLRGTDLLGFDTGSLWHRLHGRAARWMTRRSLPCYERVLVMSNRMRRELKQWHGRESGVSVLPSGIDLARFCPIDRMEARRRLGFAADERPWVLFATIKKNNPTKRLELAAATFNFAKAKRSDLVMHTLSGVRHDDVPLWMNAANVLLMTSTREGWPNVVKEAIACNVPFVSTDVSDLAEIARQEPSCTVTEANPIALGDGLLSAINYGRCDSLRRHVETMSLPITAEQLCTIYENILARPRRAAA